MINNLMKMFINIILTICLLYYSSTLAIIILSGEYLLISLIKSLKNLVSHDLIEI